MDEDDLCRLGNLSEDSAADALERRYLAEKIYMRSGLVLLAMNPYRLLDIYGRSVMQAYFNRTDGVEPHIYDVAEAVYQDLGVHGDQTVVISGESGSGKSESTRLVIRYLLQRTESDGAIESRIEAANAVLEAFGNAQTAMNSNSSRFGKRIRLVVGEQISGAFVETYLLEKSRVTHQAEGEKNFHVFYQLCASRGVDVENDFICTGGDAEQLRMQYSQTVLAMREVGVENVEEIEECLLGILHLGGVRFSEDVRVVRNSHFREFCVVFGVDEDAVEESLVRHTLRVRGEAIDVQNTEKQALTIRNSMARLLYSNLFDHVAACINRCLNGGAGPSIAVLDIFGFETSASNGFDQLCINWANEKIQNEFVQQVFRDRQEMYRDEGIEWNDVEFSGNERCIEDFEKPCGLADLINEESLNAWGSARNLGAKIARHVGGTVRMRGDRMVVSHYAGDVDYSLDAFLEKNREQGSLKMFRNGFIARSESRESVIRDFKQSMDALFQSINKTQIKYIRCLRPNGDRMSGMFERNLVLKQLRECGVLETIRISRQCFPQEMRKEVFLERYRVLGDSVFENVGLREGSTRFFLDNESVRILEMRRYGFFEESFRTIRKAFRVHLERVRAGKGQEEPELVERLAVLDIETAEMEIEERDKDPHETIRELEARIEQYRKFCGEPCRSCRSLELKYRFQSEALRKKNMVELELERYKARVEQLERRIGADEDSDVGVSFTNSYNVFSCLIELYLEFLPAFAGGEIPRPEILGFAHSAFHAVERLERGVAEGTRCMVEELGQRLHVFERCIHKVSFVLANLIEFGDILRSMDMHVDELDGLVATLFRHLCELQRGSLLQVLPHAVLDHQQLARFRCSEGYLRRIFRPPSISKLTRMLEYFHAQMTHYCVPEKYVLEAVNYMLRTVNASVFNSLLVKKGFLSFNRGVQINYNVNEIDKFCRGIGYLEGMLNLAHTASTIRLINLVEAHADADSILEECSILNCMQIREIVAKFDNPMPYAFGEDSRSDKFLPEPSVSLPQHAERAAHSFVCPRYLPAESLLSIFRSIK